MANASNATPAVIAARIVDAVGGPANITSLTHCATRLHFELADAGHVNQHGLESIPGVLGAFPRAGNRYQVIIGGAVASVYEQIVRLRTARLMPAAQLPSAVMQSASQSTQPTQSMQPTQPAQPAQSAQSTQPTQPAQSAPYLSDDAAPSRDTATDAEQSCGPSNTSRHFMPRTIREWGSAARARAAAFFDYLSDSFRPILGVLLGASLVIAIVNVIVALGIVPDGETSAGWILLKAIWEGVFTVLPIMIAYNAAKKLDVDPWLGGAIMAALMTPQFTGVMSGMSGTSVSSALSGGDSMLGHRRIRRRNLHRVGVRHTDSTQRLQWQHLRTIAHGRRARRGLPRAEARHSRQRTAGVRAIPLTGRRFCAHHTGYRASGNMARQRAGSGHSMA